MEILHLECQSSQSKKGSWQIRFGHSQILFRRLQCIS